MANEVITNEFFIAEGENAKKQAEQSSSTGAKTNYVKLGAGDSIRVMLLDKNFPNYYGHSDFNLKIPSHLCTAPRPGMKCKSCDAGIKRSMKFMVPLYDIDKNEVVVWDTSKKHVAAVYSIIEAYGDDVVSEIFILKRTGSSAQDTSYSFIALPPKQKSGIKMPDVKPFELGSQERSDFYNSILRAPSEEYLAKLLAKASGDGQATSVEHQSDDYNF